MSGIVSPEALKASKQRGHSHRRSSAALFIFSLKIRGTTKVKGRFPPRVKVRAITSRRLPFKLEPQNNVKERNKGSERQRGEEYEHSYTLFRQKRGARAARGVRASDTAGERGGAYYYLGRCVVAASVTPFLLLESFIPSSQKFCPPWHVYWPFQLSLALL